MFKMVTESSFSCFFLILTTTFYQRYELFLFTYQIKEIIVSNTVVMLLPAAFSLLG
ncbi:hypothetical protein GCWU000342_01073 [Shuttleworthella satelles DSM 14600]|uniref:Uncharacterized protein n=1 Tax=Shuttleworthella satelles DSM 14600 TaxID=626523 RepID=C4GAX2_9FIRM|nr:hypothetical protein GCWU000342_01073 [Shuttleworthia satelles DSM 14600]